MCKDATYMKFDFSDGECQHFPVEVRIDKKLNHEQLKQIDDSIQQKMNEYIENEEYWDADNILVEDVMNAFAPLMDFNYEIIDFDYVVDCE